MKKKEINKLDQLWSEIIKNRAGYKCEHCGISGVRMEAAHVVGRRHRGTRWGCWVPWVSEERKLAPKYDFAGHCLCHSCHQHYDEHGPLELAITENTVGLERKARLQQVAQAVARDQDYDEIKALLIKYGGEYVGS